MKIALAAIKTYYPESKCYQIYTGWRHADIYEWMHCAEIPRGPQMVYEEGFMTDDNRFVDRYEAAKIAIEANQIPKNFTGPLWSEEVW